MHRILATPLHAILIGSLFVFAACDSNGGTPENTGGSLSSPAPTVDVATSTVTPTEGSTGTATEWDDSVLTLRDGVWTVGDTGEVEFTVQGDRLELLAIRPAEGWSVREQEVEADEIEVDFERGNVDWKFEVELDNGILEIEIDQDIENAEAGTYTVGLAGTVEFEFADGSLRLIEVLPNEGWSHTVEEQDSDDIEIDFRRDNVTWEFNLDLDDGRIEVEIDFEIEGRFPA